jgi:hypothetical protein
VALSVIFSKRYFHSWALKYRTPVEKIHSIAH